MVIIRILRVEHKTAWGLTDAYAAYTSITVLN